MQRWQELLQSQRMTINMVVVLAEVMQTVSNEGYKSEWMIYFTVSHSQLPLLVHPHMLPPSLFLPPLPNHNNPLPSNQVRFQRPPSLVLPQLGSLESRLWKNYRNVGEMLIWHLHPS